MRRPNEFGIKRIQNIPEISNTLCPNTLQRPFKFVNGSVTKNPVTYYELHVFTDIAEMIILINYIQVRINQDKSLNFVYLPH